MFVADLPAIASKRPFKRSRACESAGDSTGFGPFGPLGFFSSSCCFAGFGTFVPLAPLSTLGCSVGFGTFVPFKSRPIVTWDTPTTAPISRCDNPSSTGFDPFGSLVFFSFLVCVAAFGPFGPARSRFTVDLPDESSSCVRRRPLSVALWSCFSMSRVVASATTSCSSRLLRRGRPDRRLGRAGGGPSFCGRRDD
jgi:hypothetical protein